MRFKGDGCGTDRRFFLGRIMRYSAAACTAAVLPLAVVSGQEKKGRLLATVKLADHPNLAKVGGFVLIEDTPAGDLLIIRSSDNEYTSLSPVCPHKQCKVEVMNPVLIQCPCHKSAYKIDGTLIHGPSKASLKKFATRVEGGVITTLEN
jgi:nitrite reductase/ring-hydroxylating ferredoxin subunit